MLYARFLKRGCDVVAAAALVVLLLPVIAAVWVAVRLTLGAPVLFCAERAGKGGRPIMLAKFRSMTAATGPDGGLLPDDQRLTPVGRFLRRTSLDELPQLFSVLAGSMSLIGPRPLPLRYSARYSRRQARRLEVLPGLTGWAQIHGRNSLDWPARLELDVQYVDMLGRWFAPFLDLWIAGCTIVQIAWQAVTGRGISAPGTATMSEFR
ncbi:MAG: sugar transferase [Planctomycetia bacterium]|nr:sugar transferase [Planctomycetia bacterium]